MDAISMNLFGKGSAKELKKLNDQVHTNFENAIERGETFITIYELVKGTMLEHMCSYSDRYAGFILESKETSQWIFQK